MNQDSQLSDKLRTEWPGILAWIVGGCLEWQKLGLAAPECVTTATQGYRVESDVLGAFIADRCTTNPTAMVAACDLYAEYKSWADAGGEYVQTQTTFGRALAERGFENRPFGPKRRKHYFGIGLVVDCEERQFTG